MTEHRMVEIEAENLEKVLKILGSAFEFVRNEGVIWDEDFVQTADGDWVFIDALGKAIELLGGTVE